MCTDQIVVALHWGSAVFAGVAAVLWLKSALVKIPSSFPVVMVSPDLGVSPQANKLGEALIRQSKWSAAAALSAAASALCQALAFFF
jgi:hypothetical protein